MAACLFCSVGIRNPNEGKRGRPPATHSQCLRAANAIGFLSLQIELSYRLDAGRAKEAAAALEVVRGMSVAYCRDAALTGSMVVHQVAQLTIPGVESKGGN